MRRVMVRYRVKPERVEENVTLVGAVYAELARTQPAGLHYETFRLPDGCSFVHVATIDTPDGSNPLRDTQAFAAFTSGIAERCDEAPITTELSSLGAYRSLVRQSRP